MSFFPSFGGELGQWASIADLNARVARQERRERWARIRAKQSTDDRLAELEDAVGQLSLFVRTLYRLAIEKGSITPAEFAEAANAVDRSDGTQDGKYTSGERP